MIRLSMLDAAHDGAAEKARESNSSLEKILF